MASVSESKLKQLLQEQTTQLEKHSSETIGKVKEELVEMYKNTEKKFAEQIEILKAQQEADKKELNEKIEAALFGNAEMEDIGEEGGGQNKAMGAAATILGEVRKTVEDLSKDVEKLKVSNDTKFNYDMGYKEDDEYEDGTGESPAKKGRRNYADITRDMAKGNGKGMAKGGKGESVDMKHTYAESFWERSVSFTEWPGNMGPKERITKFDTDFWPNLNVIESGFVGTTAAKRNGGPVYMEFVSKRDAIKFRMTNKEAIDTFEVQINDGGLMRKIKCNTHREDKEWMTRKATVQFAEKFGELCVVQGNAVGHGDPFKGVVDVDGYAIAKIVIKDVSKGEITVKPITKYLDEMDRRDMEDELLKFIKEFVPCME